MDTGLPGETTVEGYVRDDVGRQQQEGCLGLGAQRSYLSTMKRPELGMFVETNIRWGNSQGWLHYTGMITYVGEPPKGPVGGSLLWQLVNGENTITEQLSDAVKREFILDNMGCVHGQEIRSISEVTETTDQAPRLVEIVYRFDDNMFYPWAVQSVRPISHDEKLQDFFFQTFDGCSCPRCLEKRSVGEKPTQAGNG